MQTLSYGFKLPENGDKGSVWFPALSDDITQLNGHTHNGTNSAQISSSTVLKGTVSIPNASWSLISTGKYRQTVNVPAGFNMSDYSITIYLTSSGHLIYPTIEKVSSSSFYIYTCDNTLDYTAVFR